MDESTPVHLSYTGWRAEAAHISDLAKHIASEASLSSLIDTVRLPLVGTASPSSTSTAAAASSTSFFSQLFSSGASDESSKAGRVPWSASLAQLMALAEMPPPANTENDHVGSALTNASASQAGVSSSSSSSSSSFRFAQLAAIVANSSRTQAEVKAAAAATTAATPSLVSSSHALLPHRQTAESSPRPPQQQQSQAWSGPPSRTSHRYPHGSITDKEKNHRDDDEEDDSGDDEGFDRMFARLKQQAAEKSHQQQQRQQPEGRRGSSTNHPNPSAAGVKAETSSARRTSASRTEASASPLSGLAAARAALDTTSQLIFRTRQQNNFSTAPSGRITEAQTHVLRASISRSAQLFTRRILETVEEVLRQHQPQAVVVAHPTNNAGHDCDAFAFARSVEAGTVDALYQLLQHGVGPPGGSPNASTSLTAHRVSGRSFDHRASTSQHPSHSSGRSSLVAVGDAAKGMAPLGSPTRQDISPTSAAALSFYHAASPAVHRAAATGGAVSAHVPPTPKPQQQQQKELLSVDAVAALQQWRQLVQMQQRALCAEEVGDLVAAGHLFLGAAAERSQLGSRRHHNSRDDKESSDGCGIGQREGGRAAVRQDGHRSCGGDAALGNTVAEAELASFGVMHMLRACGILMSDPLLKHDTAYPAPLLRELERVVSALQTSSSPPPSSFASSSPSSRLSPASSTSWSSPPVLLPSSHPRACAAAASTLQLPPLLHCPHAPRAWMLLAQTATYVQRHRLAFPWDSAIASCSHQETNDNGGCPSFPSPSHAPPVAHAAASACTVQMLWEMAAAVLLCPPRDALRAMAGAVELKRRDTGAGDAQATPLSRGSAMDDNAPAQVNASLRGMFHTLLQQQHSAATSAAGAATTPSSPSSLVFAVPELAAQPSTLPLCLLSIRAAVAAAVRAGHYAEALQDTEVALFLLLPRSPSPSSQTNLAHSEGDNPSQRERTIDYSKVVEWTSSGAAGASPYAAVRTSAALPSLRHFNSRVHFLLVRLFLLLVSAPLAAGAAATSMIAGGVLFPRRTESETKDEEEKAGKENSAGAADGCPAAVPVSHAQTEREESRSRSAQLSAVATPVQAAPSPASPTRLAEEAPAQSVATPTETHTNSRHGTEPSASPQATGAAEEKTVTDMQDTLEQTMKALQRMAAELRVLETEGLMVHSSSGRGGVGGGVGSSSSSGPSTQTRAPAMPQQHHQHQQKHQRRGNCASVSRGSDGVTLAVVPYLPAQERRLSAVLGGGGCSPRGTMPGRQDAASSLSLLSTSPAIDAASYSLTDVTKVDEPGAARRRCTLTRSAQFQRLKQAHASSLSMAAAQASNGTSDSQTDTANANCTATTTTSGMADGSPLSSAHAAAGVAELAGSLDGERSVRTDLARDTDRDDYSSHSNKEEEDDEGDDEKEDVVLRVSPEASAAVDDLHELMCELLLLVCLLTLPLRAQSTCTSTAETNLHLPPNKRATAAAAVAEEEEERGGAGGNYDVEYMQARLALNTFDLRLEKSMSSLGVRDPTIFTLLRHLQTEVLFPF